MCDFYFIFIFLEKEATQGQCQKKKKNCILFQMRLWKNIYYQLHNVRTFQLNQALALRMILLLFLVHLWTCLIFLEDDVCGLSVNRLCPKLLVAVQFFNTFHFYQKKKKKKFIIIFIKFQLIYQPYHMRFARTIILFFLSFFYLSKKIYKIIVSIFFFNNV